MSKSKRSIGEKYNSPFAKSIRELMCEQGTTQDVLAEKIGKTRQTISQYVNGISEPGYDTLIKIADYFNVSTDYLLGRTKTKSADETEQAVIAYTGLSEENVKTLHGMAQHLGGEVVAQKDSNVIYLDGNKPFLDCLNDLLEAVYSDRSAIAKHYIRLRRKTKKNDAVDFWYVIGEHKGPIPGLEPAEYSDWKTQIPFDNELVESDCMKISRKIEESFVKKYVATQEEIERLYKDIDDLESRYKHPVR